MPLFGFSSAGPTVLGVLNLPEVKGGSPDTFVPHGPGDRDTFVPFGSISDEIRDTFVPFLPFDFDWDEVLGSSLLLFLLYVL